MIFIVWVDKEQKSEAEWVNLNFIGGDNHAHNLKITPLFDLNQF